MTRQFVTKDGIERITVTWDPNDPDHTFAEINRSEKKPGDKRFTYVDSIAIPRELVDSVCAALKGKSRT